MGTFDGFYVLILASGRAERFRATGGVGNKLDALIEGKRVLDWACDAARQAGVAVHVEGGGHPGMGDSIAAAVKATEQAQGWLILPGDLPLVQGQTIRSVAQALAQGAPAAYPVHQGQRGHPVGFGHQSRAQLLNLRGNQGAAAELSRLFATEIIVNDPGCVLDVDTVELLEQARLWARERACKPSAT